MSNVLIMAGGTGGHIFPALAVAELLKKQGAAIQWLGTEKGLESRLVPEHHYPINYIDIGGLRGKGIKTLLLLPFKLIKAVIQTLKVYQQVKPDVILGMGGFVTGPGGLVGWLLGKPLVLHEQNAIAGLTNKILYRLSKKVFAAFPGAFPASYKMHKLRVIGNPVRKEIGDLIDPQEYYQKKWFKKDQITTESALNILVVGGSLGAAALNEKVPQALELIDSDDSYWANDSYQVDDSYRVEDSSATNGFNHINVRHQCGEKNLPQTRENYSILNRQSDARVNVEVMAFISNMAESYQWADLVICRSGALTVSEIAAAGIASILVPFPYAVDDHQTANAQYLVNEGAACLIQQKDLTKGKLAGLIMTLDKKTILTMACKARKLAIDNAAEVVAKECLLLAGCTYE